VVATGRSDYPNQINNVLAFPGVFRGLLDASATRVDSALLLAAAEAISNTVTEDELNSNYIIPSVLHADVHTAVAHAVRTTAGGDR
jgi:malate dehydrogenase (oxaloacetate-decarboxylating)